MLRGRVAAASPRRRLVFWMVLSVAAVALAALLDDARASREALEDFGREQATLAAVGATALGPGLAAARDARAALSPLPLTGGRVWLLRTGGGLYAADGRRVEVAAIERAFDAGARAARLSRAEAARVGLPARTAVAGLARMAVLDAGRGGVVVVASAARERDRQIRERWRLVLGVALVAGLTMAFGGVALRTQRAELDLARALDAAELGRAREAQLARESRAATMVTLAAGVAHEVATPLNVIIGRAEQVLERGSTDERGQRALRSIVEQAEGIRQVVQGLVGLARGDPPSMDRLAPAAVARAAAALVAHRFARSRVALRVDLDGELPAILGDRRLLEQALVNLLLNACDACEGGGAVALGARADTGAVCFEVADDGTGISPEHAARVMEPFFSTKPRGRGTGLGLAVTREIVQLHRGALALASRQPRGTVATIRVPVAEVAE